TASGLQGQTDSLTVPTRRGSAGNPGSRTPDQILCGCGRKRSMRSRLESSPESGRVGRVFEAHHERLQWLQEALWWAALEDSLHPPTPNYRGHTHTCS